MELLVDVVGTIRCSWVRWIGLEIFGPVPPHMFHWWLRLDHFGQHLAWVFQSLMLLPSMEFLAPCCYYQINLSWVYRSRPRLQPWCMPGCPRLDDFARCCWCLLAKWSATKVGIRNPPLKKVSEKMSGRISGERWRDSNRIQNRNTESAAQKGERENERENQRRAMTWFKQDSK